MGVLRILRALLPRRQRLGDVQESEWPRGDFHPFAEGEATREQLEADRRPRPVPEDPNLEADAAERYWTMIGADLPNDERARRAREVTAPDIVLDYLDRLRSMEPSERLARDIDEVEAEVLAQRRAATCAHCGESFADRYARGYARLSTGERVCHPNDYGPDCYRLVTVYGQTVGSPIGHRDEWVGVRHVGRKGGTG